MPQHFSSVEPVDVSGTGWRGLDLFFRRVEHPPPANEAVENLRRAFEAAVQKLRLVARNEDEFMPIFNEITDGARSSLATAGGTVNDGNDRLSDIKLRILSLARNRRRGYFISIILCGVFTSVGGLFLWAVASLIPKLLPLTDWGYAGSYADAVRWLVPACLILPGASLGISFVGFATNRMLVYDNVGRMDQYDFVPWERFIWVILIGFVLLAALWFNVFVLGIGNIVLNKVTDQAGYGFLIGLVCGVSESLVAELLVSRLRPVARGGTSP